MQKFVINPPVFYGSVAIIGAFLALGVLAPDAAETVLSSLQSWILERFGWLYIFAVAAFVVTAVVFALSRTGTLKLGPDDSEPDFNYATWFSMLFAAGMGIGLMFFAVGEPMTHYAAPPEAAPGTIAARREAMLVTFFHWGVHAWAIYAIVGLSLAYFGYRYNLPLTVRSGLYPLLKEKIYGPIGHAVDIFAICGTLFGIATSLGLGVLQINSGLNYLLGVPVSTWFQVVLIACITLVATLSAVSGVERGVRRLSELNLMLAVLLMIFVLLVGPTAFLFNTLVQNVGLYLDNFVAKTFNIYAYEPRPWIESWTLFYWAWWISWSPFVGMFIARISRGRTVREFTVGVLLVPVGFTFVWMTVFGNTAMYIDEMVANGALAAAVSNDISVALFQFLEYLPLSGLTSTIAIMLVAVFFITSSDSGSLVVDTISAGGQEAPASQRVFWCTLEGAVAAVLLVAGGLSALQTAAIASALPFTFVMLILCVGLFRGMRSDLALRETATLPAPAHASVDLSWRKRLERVLHTPNKADVEKFLTGTVQPALKEVVAELKKRGMVATVERDKENDEVCLVVPSDGPRNFVYGVRLASHRLPAFDMREIVDSASGRLIGYDARTFFSDGSRGYDVMGLTKDQIIADVLTQFERYWAVVHSQPSQLYVTSPDAA